MLVGHVTKDGAVAGPRVLEHLVDCVLQFEGDRYREHRVLRATKNRFGSTNELGVFEMTSAGLVGVPDPSELFGTTRPRRGRRCRRVRARGNAAAPARDPGAGRADRSRDAAARRNRGRPEAARDDRRGSRAARWSPAGQCGCIRERRGRRSHRGARRRPRGRARDRVGGARRTGTRGLAAFGEIGLTGRLRQAVAGRAASGRVREARHRHRGRASGRRDEDEHRASSRRETLRAALTAGLEQERRVEEAAA